MPGTGRLQRIVRDVRRPRGAERFFAARGDDRPRRASGGSLGRRADVLDGARRGGRAPASGVRESAIDDAQRQALFAALQTDVAARHWQTQEYSGFWRQPINNAVIVHDQLYADRLPLFAAALACQGGDLRATIAAILAALDTADDPFVAVAALAVCEGTAG